MCDCNDYVNYIFLSACGNDLGHQESYYIETSVGKIPFMSKDIENIRIRSRKVDEYINFLPINNVKFLKFADKYCTKYMMELNIYSEKTKNGVFLKLSTYDYTAEYKIFKVNK